MSDISACFSHKTDDWKTPKFLYDYFMSNGYIDPCPFQCSFNGLDKDYYDKKLFINPPYSDLSNWVDYAINQYKHGCYVVMLIPARTDTLYFHKLLDQSPKLIFIKGRLHFNESKYGAPFPSLIVVLGDCSKTYEGLEVKKCLEVLL